MNNRERLLTVLKGEVPDRVPVSLYLEEEFLGFMFPGRVVERKYYLKKGCSKN